MSIQHGSLFEMPVQASAVPSYKQQSISSHNVINNSRSLSLPEWLLIDSLEFNSIKHRRQRDVFLPPNISIAMVSNHFDSRGNPSKDSPYLFSWVEIVAAATTDQSGISGLGVV